MACALTQGYSLDCRDSLGGLKEIYIIEHANVTAITEASGVVTALTKASGKRFWKYEIAKQVASLTETLTGSEENGTVFYAQALNTIINKMQASIRNEIKLLAKNKLLIIAVDKNDASWMVGRNGGAFLNTGSGTTGVAMGDRNGYTLDFSASEAEPMPTVQTSVVSALETPGT